MILFTNNGILFHLAKPVFHQRVCVSSKSVFQKTSLYNGKRQRYICIMSGQWYSLSLSNEWLSRSPKALSLNLVKCLSKGDLLLMVPCKNIICVFHRDSYEKRIRTLFLFSQEDSLPISLNNQCFRCILYYFFLFPEARHMCVYIRLPFSNVLDIIIRANENFPNSFSFLCIF